MIQHQRQWLPLVCDTIFSFNMHFIGPYNEFELYQATMTPFSRLESFVLNSIHKWAGVCNWHATYPNYCTELKSSEFRFRTKPHTNQKQENSRTNSFASEMWWRRTLLRIKLRAKSFSDLSQRSQLVATPEDAPGLPRSSSQLTSSTTPSKRSGCQRAFKGLTRVKMVI